MSELWTYAFCNPFQCKMMENKFFVFILAFFSTLVLAEANLASNEPSVQGEGIEFQNPAVYSPSTTRHLEFENEYVRVWKTTILPQQPLKMHRHECGRVIYGIEEGSLERINEAGEKSELVFDAGKAYWYEADPKGELHGDVNLADKPVVVLVVEIKAATTS